MHRGNCPTCGAEEDEFQDLEIIQEIETGDRKHGMHMQNYTEGPTFPGSQKLATLPPHCYVDAIPGLRSSEL